MTRSPADAAHDLGAAASGVAGALYDLDNAPDMVFVRTQADAGNRDAAAVASSLSLAWERYALLKDAVDRLDAAVAARRAGEIDALLGPSAVALPDGTSLGLAQLVDDVQVRLEHIGPRVAALAGAARQAVAKLDGAQAATRDLVARAAALGAGDDPELTALRAALDRAIAAVGTDPTAGTDLADLDRLVDEARARVETLERHRQQVPAALGAAAAELDQIEAVARRGAEALALTRAKMGPGPGLLDPVDLTAGGDRALRPWLARVRAQADAGDWDAAATGLAAWQAAADGCLAEVTRVAEANAAPLARRNELRGLVDAYRAKAAALGHDEDGRLERLHGAARTVLYTAPCDLDVAETLVRDYVGAVNASVGGTRR
jgi:hypothetical protein